MLPYWIIVGVMSIPCTSSVEHTSRETVVHQCPVQLVQTLPMGWRPGMFDDTNREILSRKPKVEKAKVAPEKKSKKRRRR